MAGAKIELEIDNNTAVAALDYAVGRLDSDGRQLLLSRIGEYMVGSTRDRASTQRGPDGQRWPALSPPYARRKAKARPGLKMLRYDGNMLGAEFTFQLDGDDAVLVGTNAIYGASHQFGRGGIPARPWLGADDADNEEIVVITRAHLIDGMPES